MQCAVFSSHLCYDDAGGGGGGASSFLCIGFFHMLILIYLFLLKVRLKYNDTTTLFPVLTPALSMYLPSSPSCTHHSLSN